MIEPQAQLTAFWRGQTRRFALALSEGFIHFWEPDSAEFQAAPDEWVFCVEGIIGVAHPEMLAEVMPYQLEQAIESGSVGRRIALYDTMTVFLRADENSSLYFHLGDIKKHMTFYLDYREKLFDAPASRWTQQLEQRALESVENDDFAEGLIQPKVPFAHDRRSLMLIGRGDYEELARITDLIFSLEPAWISKTNGGVLVILPWQKPARIVATQECKVAHCLFTSHPRAALWDEWLRFFQPTLDTEFHRADLEGGVRLFWCTFGPQDYWNKFNDALDQDKPMQQPPIELSQHERMEIVLPLGRWLRERAGLSDERINELLA